MNRKAIDMLWNFSEAEGRGGRRVRLDAVEATIYLTLLKKEPYIVAYAELAADAFDSKSKTGALASYIGRLRRKLGKRRILTVTHRGYRLAGS